MSARKIRDTAAWSIAALIGAPLILCSCSPAKNATLERASMRLNEAKEDPHLSTYAPMVLQEAENTLERADREWRSDKDREEVEHLVYLTERKIEIAREEARRKMAEVAASSDRDAARRAAERLRAQVNERERTLDRHAAELSREHAQLVGKLRAELDELRARETEAGLELTLSDQMLFSSGSAVLKPGAMRRLDPVADYLIEHPERTVVIEGHTDNVGSEEYNRDLSQRRADAVRRALMERGIRGTQIVSRGLGEGYPLASNSSQAGRLQNRRVELILSGA